MKIKACFFVGLLLILLMFFASCSKRIFEARETHKLHDMYFILRENGHYSFKMLFMGVLLLPDSERGRYIRSVDTVYFLNKLKGKTFETYGYGIIDSVSGTFLYRPNETTEERTFDMIKMHLKRDDK
jgi:hypothetical protein